MFDSEGSDYEPLSPPLLLPFTTWSTDKQPCIPSPPAASVAPGSRELPFSTWSINPRYSYSPRSSPSLSTPRSGVGDMPFDTWSINHHIPMALPTPLSCAVPLTATNPVSSVLHPTLQHQSNAVNARPALYMDISDKDVGSRRRVKSRLSALIIGIDSYSSPKVGNIRGAVNDALAVKKFLEGYLDVPSTQIRLLRDAEATRSAIIQQFNNLISDPPINRDDPILLFFAGHGGEADAPKDWETDGSKIPMLIPHDFRTIVDGRVTHGIPDRTISALLSRVAENRGENITVIFDSCHSGSGSLPVPGSSRIARFVDVPDEVPSDLDQDIWNAPHPKKPGFAINSGFLHHRRTSHILLAACGSKETAYEEQGKGIFTTALLKLLSEAGAPNLTYADLLQQLPRLPEQNPRCTGLQLNRALFSAKAESRGHVLFKVETHGDIYVMDAGTTRGIDVGDEFTLYQDPQALFPLGIFVVRDARPFCSTMAPLHFASQPKPHRPAFALPTKASNTHDLSVYVAEHRELVPVFVSLAEEMHRVRPDRPGIQRVEKDKATIIVDVDHEKVVFDTRLLGERAAALRSSRLIPFSAELDVSKLSPILYAAAHWHWHLCRTNQHHNLRNGASLEFTKLKRVERVRVEDLNPVVEPVGDNLNQNGIINLVTGPQEYGMRILNNSAVPLYAALFYFDINNLSITLLSPLPLANDHKADSLLPPKESITFGYGSNAPLVFTLAKGRDIEVGFLKLFLFTEYVDLSDIEQTSPFKGARPIERFSMFKKLWDLFDIKQLSPFTSKNSIGRNDASMKVMDLPDIEHPSPFTSAHPINQANVPAEPSMWDTILVAVVLRKG